MVALNRHVLGLLDIVNRLQNGESVTDAGDTHLLEVVMLKSDKSFPNDLVFYAVSS